MRLIRRYPRAAFMLLCLTISAIGVGFWMFRHYRFPSLAEAFPQGELVVAIDPSYPPFGNIVDDTFVGLDVDLGRALAEHLGLTVRYVMVNFDSAYDAVETGTAQLSLAALRVDNGRMSDFYYTWGYFNDGVMLASLSGIQDGWDLGGTRVGVELGSASHAEARKWSRRVKGLEILTFSTPAETIEALLNRETVEAVLIDAISLREYLQAHPVSPIAASYLTSEFYAGAVRIDRRDVLYHLNGAMLALLNDGTIEALLKRHIGPEPRAVRP
jgi:polar amino acid transport system substrate-binding protein